MPSLREIEFHMTFTDSGGLSQDQVDSVVQWVKKKGVAYCAVQEGGDSGNAHVHAYVRFEKPKVASNLRKQVGSVYGDLKVDVRRLKITKVNDYRVLVGGYFVKEEDHIMLVCENVDVKSCTEYAQEFLRKKRLNNNRISYVSAHHTIYDWCVRNKCLLSSEDEFKSVLVKMAKDGYPVHVLMGKLLWVYSMYMTCYGSSDVDLLERLEADMHKQRDREIREFRG